MRVIIQRVEKSKVLDKDQKRIVGQIKSGFLILLGIKKGDSKKGYDENKRVE